MRVYLFPNEFYASIPPRFLHVCDPYFPVLDQYSGDPSSSMIRATGHQLVSLCRSGGGGEESAPGSFNDQLVLRNCSVGLRNSVVSPSVFFVARA